MKKIKIFDTTLRDGEQSVGCTMTIEEKISVAMALDKLGVDIIEAGFAASSKNDNDAIKEISKVVKKATVASLARCKKEDIDAAYNALKECPNKRVHVFIAISDIHMQDKLHMNKEEVIKKVIESISYAKKYFDDIEFSCEDATRSDKEFLKEVCEVAILSGATTINIPDTVGYTNPIEFYELIKYLKDNVEGIDKVDLSVHTHNDLGQATANSLIAIQAGASQIECTVMGIGERSGNTSLEEIVANIKTRSDYYNCYTDINTPLIYQTSCLVSDIINYPIPRTKPIIGENVFKHESGIHQHGVIQNRKTYEIMNPNDYGINCDNIVLGVHSGKHAVIKKINDLGLNSDNYDIDDIIEDIKEGVITNNNFKQMMKKAAKQ